MSDIVCRPARLEDCDAIATMVRRLAADTGASTVPRAEPADYARFGFGDAPILRLYVAERAGETIGCLVGEVIFSTWRGKPGLYVCDLHVEAGHRGRGTGARLIDCAVRHAPPHGYGFVKLEVMDDNRDAQRFYKRLGFEAKPEEVTHVLTLTPSP
ncbi:MAG: GNAT family N-acetyltransferase [Hyphomicrobiaceae bacterium]|nr:GNAT family N-acetyltransferase [Hyphomicrobiaceae bacterium]